jgi:Metallopeptidase family M81
MRVATAGVHTETNTFSPVPADFGGSATLRGEEIVAELSTAHHTITGFPSGRTTQAALATVAADMSCLPILGDRGHRMGATGVRGVVTRNSPPEGRPTPRTRKAPTRGAFRRCAEEDSNLHPVIPDQALNLARLPIPPSAREGRSIAPAGTRFSGA